MVFKSEVDWWYYAIIVAVTLVVLYALRVNLTSGRPGQLMFLTATLVASVGLPVWLLLSTDYRVADGLLSIRCGPFKSAVPLDAIRSVHATRDSRSSPALSLERLEIRYDGGRVLISPEDRDGFLRAIGRELSP